MVFKTITNFSRYSSTKSSASHSFFDPTYIKQQKVSVIDGILGTSNRHSSTAHPHASISTASNFIVFDPNFLQHNNNGNNNTSNANQNKEGRILFKRASHKVNKNGHVNISVDSITDQFTTLTLRKSNSPHTKTIKINKENFIKANSSQTVTPAQQEIKEVAQSQKSPELAQPEPVQYYSEEHNEDTELNDSPIRDDDFLTFSYSLMQKNIQEGKNNEVYAIYTRIKDRSLTPTLKIYNTVLQSIPLRTNVKETTEENLTLLLDVYSDMLTNGVKPNEKTYGNVITPLLNASIQTYIAKDTTQAEQYFKIANELFTVGLTKRGSFAPELYEKILVSYNLMKFSGVEVRKLGPLIADKLGFHNIIYYLGLMNCCKHSKDWSYAMELYSQFRAVASNYPQLLQHQLQVYSCVITTLVACGKIDMASSTLDKLITNFRSQSGLQKDVAPLFSAFLVGLTEIGLVEKAYSTLVKFDAVPWLPKVPINSLMLLVDNACNAKEFDYALKFWEFAVVRDDFDSSVIDSDNNLVNLMANVSSVETKMAFSKLVQLAFFYGDKTGLVRLSKELILKDTLHVSTSLLIEMTQFLFYHGLPKLAMAIISNQGLKLERGTNANQYLNSIIDAVPTEFYPELMSSQVFNSAVEQYSLIDDNIYGIYNAIKFIWTSGYKGDEKFEWSMNRCYNVLFEELNDLNNFYVEIPDEIKQFKKTLEKKITFE